MSIENIRTLAEMSFKAEKDTESGKWKIYNKAKETYSSRMYKDKETATRVIANYDRFKTARKTKKEDKPKEEKESDMSAPKPKKKVVRKVKKEEKS